ncbi:4-hydroxyphenylpyruvate dioxygenase [Streptomyces sp. 7-21]|nr:4-hydroxyphenylpyruvate dioxygenase [Streptomyces sp. 7-21]
MYVENLEKKTFAWVDRYGFSVVGTGGSADHRSTALRHGDITLVLTEATSARHPASGFVLAHGDGVADIALRTPDAAAAFAAAVAGGAAPLREPARRSGDGPRVTAAVAGFGDVAHTLVERDPGEGPGLPVGFVPALGPQPDPAHPAGLTGVDHVAVCLAADDLEPVTARYERALGFRRVFADRTVIGAHAMRSQVVRSASGAVTLTLLAPDPAAGPGQTDEFLKDHHGPGVQHVAFAARDAVRAVRALSARGVAFLPAPAAGDGPPRAGSGAAGHRREELRAAGVFADADRDGELFQAFTASTHPRRTLFFEITERRGASTFGRANIRGLYEAVERERTGRGAFHG